MAKTRQHSANGFRIVGVVPGPVLFKKKMVDLSRLTLKEARELVKQGCPYVEIIDKAS